MAKVASSQRRNWTRGETLAAFNLYSRTAFGKLHSRNPDIIELAKHLRRTPGAVAMKCCNLAALDAALQARGIKGLRGTSKLDQTIWQEFQEHPEDIGYESECKYAVTVGREPRMTPADDPVLQVARTDRHAMKKIRVTQHLFREMVLTGYGGQCAICSIAQPQLLGSV